MVPPLPRTSSLKQSLAATKVLLPDNSMLALQNPFLSLAGLENEDVTGDPNTNKSVITTQIVDLHHNEHIIATNQVASNFWNDHSEVGENVSDNGEDIVHTTRKPGRLPKGVGKSKKTSFIQKVTMKVYFYFI